MEPETDRMADDIHLIATPFRLIRSFVAVSLAILFAPAILVLLIVASHLRPEDCGIAKVLIGVFGPLVFCIWFAGAVIWVEQRNGVDDPSTSLGDRQARASGLGAYFCGLAWVGILLSLMNSLTGIESLWAMVAGLFSPAVFYALGRWFGTWLTITLSLLEVGLTVFLFGRGFGLF